MFYSCLCTQSSLFHFKLSHRHTRTCTDIIFNTHTTAPNYLNAQTNTATFCLPYTKSLRSIHMQTEAFSMIPPLLFSSKFTGLINRFYVVNMADCLVHSVLYSQGLTVNITVKSSVNTLSSYHAESNLTAK